MRRVAGDMEERIRELQWETIPVAQAADECGKGRSTIYRDIKKGTLTNVGSPGHSRVRRGDLNGKRTPKTTGPSLVSKVMGSSV